MVILSRFVRCHLANPGKYHYFKDGTPSFPPPCPSCKGSDHKHAIRDIVKIPATLKAGRYVLGWRYDCEATAQVWENCADVTLVK